MEKKQTLFLIDKDLKKEAKLKAVRKDTTLTKVIVDYLTRWVKKT